MEKLKNIKRKLNQLQIKYETWENNQGISVYSCYVGDNFYDYGEDKPKLKVNDDYKFLFFYHRIRFIRCEDCCECSGW